MRMITPFSSYAKYMDPGTGSLILQYTLAVLITAGMVFRERLKEWKKKIADKLDRNEKR